MEVTSYPLLWFPRVAALRVCAPARSHVRSWLISSAVWIQRRPSLFFLQNGRQGMSQQRISQFLQTCHYAQEHAFTHVDPQEFVSLRTKLYQFAPIRSKLISRLFFFFFCQTRFQPKAERRKNRKQQSLMLLDRVNHQFTTLWNWQHTIRNHYSVANSCWQPWARQMGKWKDYNTIYRSCTHANSLASSK